ncbi:tRNA (adenosine(37)-N6)-dimethylallyltransferase MiaA [bacterium]|nr:tRNA (adenosine(37)-N6)-dimethylallyltransferase MiaA [bacterium]
MKAADEWLKTVDTPPPVLMVVGPTAVGKSAFAMAVARAWSASIISADAFQVYRGLDIGTAKVPLLDRLDPPHYLIDHCEPTDSYTLADYVTACRGLLAQTHRPWVICGGTGLYAKAILYNYQLSPPSCHRESLMARYQREGLAPLWQQLLALDPEVAHRIDAHNPRRVMRALDVALQGHLSPRVMADASPRPDIRVVVLHAPLDVLHHRIDERVRTMLDKGLVDEVQGLIAAGVSPTGPSFQAIGYKETAQWLRDNMRSLHELESTLMSKTKQFAKRQRTWFNPLKWAEWVTV